jgi:hypothetical protein
VKQRVLRFAEVNGRQFDGDLAAQAGVLRKIDRAHPARAELVDDPVMGNSL